MPFRKKVRLQTDAEKRRERETVVLQLASKQGCLDAVKDHLDRGGDLNEASKHYHQCTAVHLAALEGHAEVISVLLSRGGLVDSKNKLGRTPLHLTTSNNQIECAKLLFDSRADINAKDVHDLTPLHLAAQNGCVEIARILLIMGADVRAASKRSHATPLHLAAAKGKTEVVKLFIDHGARLDVQDLNNKTPLYHAVLEDRIKTAELLFNYQNLDINDFLARERWGLSGNTLLYVKSMFYNSKVNTIKWLLSKAADVNAANHQERTALHAAAGCPRAVKLLLSAGASVDAVTNSNETPLFLSTKYCSTEAMELLLGAGANVNAASVSGRTPLHHASEMGFTEGVKLLWSAGASVNAAGESGNTPLHIAAKFGRTEVVKTLLSRGADVNATNTDHLTPLHVAIGPHNFDPGPECQNFLQQHLIKMMALNLFVSENNSLAIRADDEMTSFWLKCEKEVELMKSKAIAHGVSFFDILTKSKKKLILYAMNDDVTRAFESNVYLSIFPIYASEIEDHFTPAIKRANLLKSGRNFFNIFLSSHLRLECICSHEILMYLSNSDLQLLGRFCKV